MNPFKVGDKILAIHDRDAPFYTKGATYTVLEIDGDVVYYRDGCLCHYKHFKLVKKLITDCIIDVRNSTLSDRLRVKQILLDNGQPIWTHTKVFTIDNNPETISLNIFTLSIFTLNIFRGWSGSTKVLPNISLEEFVQKYSKSDTTIKETTMEQNIEIKIDGKSIYNQSAKVKIERQIRYKTPYTGVIWNRDGSYNSTIYAKSKKKLIDKFKSSQYRDMTMDIHIRVSSISEDRKFIETK